MSFRRDFAAAAVVVAVLIPANSSFANPLARNTVGGGTASGGLPCGDATATGTVFNTVITGYVGDIDLHLECRPSGAVTMSATGHAVTGSTLRCPALTGSYATDGVTASVDVTGECRINNFPTAVRWQIDGTTGAGRFSVARA